MTQGKRRWGKRRAPMCTCDHMTTCRRCLELAPPWINTPSTEAERFAYDERQRREKSRA